MFYLHRWSHFPMLWILGWIFSTELMNTSQHQLGQFIVLFQHGEAALTELMVLMARSEDEEIIRMLLNDLEYSRRVRTAAAVYARFVSVSSPLNETKKVEKITAFNKVRKELLRLGEVRNALVHSRYFSWINVSGELGLIRIRSQLQGGVRDEEEHEMLPDAFAAENVALSAALVRLEEFRRQIIDWIFPDV